MKRGIRVSLILLTLFLGVSQAWAITYLPDPDTIIKDQYGNTVYVPSTTTPETLATKYGDFYAYSAKMNTLLGYTGFSGATGTGGLDIIVYTGPNGVDNDTVHAGYIFPDPLDAPGGNATSFAGVWGLADSSDHDPALVDNVLGYLHSFNPNVSIPVFNFDMNTGNDDYITIAGNVSIYDPQTAQTIKSWAFDSSDNGAFNPDNPVIALKNLVIGPYSVSNSGSGKLDYVAYAPTMDLDNPDWLGKGYEFHADFRLGSLNHGGFEELYLTGAFAPATSTPEPASLGLLGMGLLGLLGFRKRA